MNSHRVVITGMGIVSPIGNTLEAVARALREGTSGVRRIPEWEAVEGLRTRVAAPVCPAIDPMGVPRKYRRTMGRQAIFAALATKAAIEDAEIDEGVLRSGRAGVSIGSTVGSPESIYEFFRRFFENKSLVGIPGTTFFECMGHTCAANVALMVGATGRVFAPAAACASGSQAIGLAFESVKSGVQDVMIAGGADEAHLAAAMSFDLVGGTSSHFENTPERTPRPFDRDRDGLVVGEGSGIVVLESLAHATRRGARIHAEIGAYATNADGDHISQPLARGMERCIALALEDAKLSPRDIDYVNAHATATPLGDVAEAEAIRNTFGDRVPVSSAKGQTGHTLGACGALETIFTVLMMEKGFAAGTRNLDNIDDACAGILHLTRAENIAVRRALTCNFAFGGINTSLVLHRCEG